MPGARVTWVIGGAVVALVVVAGVDALRSPDDETSQLAMTAGTTTEGESGGAEAPCRPKQIAVSIGIRKPDWRNQSGYVSDDPAWKQTRVATVVVRNVGSRACDLHEEWHLVITDRRGHVVAAWRDEGLSLWGRYAPGSEKTFSPSTVYYYDYCNYPGPYVALARVGFATPARRGNLSASEITC
jgi:hypothetical protein